MFKFIYIYKNKSIKRNDSKKTNINRLKTNLTQSAKKNMNVK